ncbi:MAG: hypothetical protein JNM76_06855 [Betaproteobacteria bacterium]|nr:hypothetical protein [Betaproteobacteria bacterium]
MARDLFDILDVPETAQPAWIKRAYELRKQAVAADAMLSPQQRALELGAIEEAWRTLSNDTLREAYIARLHPTPRPLVPASAVNLLLSPGVLAFAFLCLLSGLVYAYQASQDRAKLRLEEERIAVEAQRAAKELENRAELERERIARAAENERLRIEQRQRAQFERERRNLESSQRQAQYVARAEEQQRMYMERQQQIMSEQAERQYNMEREAERRRALADLERQKRYFAEQQRR